MNYTLALASEYELRAEAVSCLNVLLVFNGPILHTTISERAATVKQVQSTAAPWYIMSIFTSNTSQRAYDPKASASVIQISL